MLAAAPTTPPCFRHWRRSSSLHFGHHQRKNYFKFRVSGKSADFPETHFHGRGRGGQRQLQRRFLRKLGAAGGRLLPLGGAVAQRLRGFESAEPEKTVKRSSRRIGVNLQFFSGVALLFGVKRGEQPLFRGSSASKSLALFWFSFGVKREHPRQAEAFHSTKKAAAEAAAFLITVCALLRSRMRCGGRAARHGCSGCR